MDVQSQTGSIFQSPDLKLKPVWMKTVFSSSINFLRHTRMFNLLPDFPLDESSTGRSPGPNHRSLRHDDFPLFLFSFVVQSRRSCLLEGNYHRLHRHWSSRRCWRCGCDLLRFQCWFHLKILHLPWRSAWISVLWHFDISKVFYQINMKTLYKLRIVWIKFPNKILPSLFS